VRVALLTNILAPYRMPVFHALAETPDWKLRVFVNAKSEFDRAWRVEPGDLDVEKVAGLSLPRRIRARGRAAYDLIATLHIPTGLISSLKRFRPDVVISAELGARTAMALLYARLAGVPLVIWSYHSRVSATSAGPLQRIWRRFLLAHAKAVVGMGSQARAVLGELGVSGDRLFDAPNAGDHTALVSAVEAADTEGLVHTLREQFGCRGRIALVPGRLVPMKGISKLIQAWESVPEEVRIQWTLLFVGSGPQAALVREAEASTEGGEIVLVPTVPPRDMAAFYAASELVVFASLGDPWGLVVNEALASGRPVACSTLAGCAEDLVRPGENGWLFNPRDPRQFRQVLQQALECPERERMRDGARATAERFRPERMADGIRRAVAHAIAPAEEMPAMERVL
jgi:glycosyltransferase involved in cell wall biosynthesis